MRKTGEKLSKLAQVMKVFPQVLINVDVAEKPPLPEIGTLQEAIKEAEAMDFPHPSTMFDDTFEEMTWMLEEQKAALLADLEDLS